MELEKTLWEFNWRELSKFIWGGGERENDLHIKLNLSYPIFCRISHTQNLHWKYTKTLWPFFQWKYLCMQRSASEKSSRKKKKGYKFGKNLWNVQSFNDLSLNFIQFQHHNQNNIHHSGDVIVETSVLTLKYWSVNCYINLFSCLKQPRGLLNRD